jgi:23S rRNA (pseudouridine1915-N3)-methyltransferase
MRIRLLTITHKVPAWVKEGYQEYVKRLPSSCTLELVEIPALKRTKGMDANRLLHNEGKKILDAINPHHYVIALDIKGTLWSTEGLAKEMINWQQHNPIDLLIGGPDGLSTECLQKAAQRWSLSPLTFPHALVRIIVVEQIYRALMVIHKHPYHR